MKNNILKAMNMKGAKVLLLKLSSNFFKEIERKLGSRKNKKDHELVEYNNNLFSAYSIYGIVLEIKDVYQGARYKDTCISEVKIETD